MATIKQMAEFTSEVFRKEWNLCKDSHTHHYLIALTTIARRLHRAFERRCNGHQDYNGNWDEKAALRDERSVERLAAQAQEIAQRMSATIYVQGDPRGWPLYLIWADDLQGRDVESCYNTAGIGVPI